MNKNISIAIDGPAAAGKSTVAKIIAQKLSYLYIDTGAMYRALTWKALQKGIDPEDGEQLFQLLKETSIELKQGKNHQKVFVDGQDVTEEIRLPEVTNSVSTVSKHASIREEMVRRQQQFAVNGGVVMDGRDIGTNVLPKAEVKIFLRAGVKERAKRRYLENVKKGIPADYDQLVEEILKRDELDSNREVAPLKKAEDAIEIDTTDLSIDQVVDQMMKYIKERKK
ncbi:(d)CMP kinase [Fervidibacillus halotolerans]|uniref:Cytidylate kinase n=1 Tax=Fervidibacillus halotolerans TaxID=2980027 RepID=A0A9E8M2E4_9BACI|nr:(d)CMP kinase [Fervidibacillus halotolerans]WAA13775.1 (d)CMP kinase [Fervidibacillus halotolerans]